MKMERWGEEGEKKDEKREWRGREEILALSKRSLVRISILQIEQMRAGESSGEM